MKKYDLPDTNLARKRINASDTFYLETIIDNNTKYLGKDRTFFIKTYGCQSNVRDSEYISGILQSLSFKFSNKLEEADLVILNTCAVRENAELKVFGEIGFLKHLKAKNKNFIFGICGCMAQEESVIKKIMDKSKEIDFIFGTHNIHTLPQILYDVIANKQKVIRVFSKEGDIYENLPSIRNSNIKAFVNIMYGCDKFCSYCIVPYTRGRLRSRKKEDIINEINSLIKLGYKEVTLLGQNVNSYGLDFKNNNYYFWNLLEDIAKLPISRIRFATSNPWNFDLKIIDVAKKYHNIMPYFHLPIQSGDETILKKMNRQMKINDYLKIINYISTNLESYAVSTDIIVGFPNETDEQFANTIKLYEQVKFDNAYTFIYSKRAGTPAAILEDGVPFKVKEKRLEQLNELVRKYAKINNEKYINKTLNVLVEGPSKTKNNILTGYSPEWKVVNFIGNAKEGQIVKVLITSASRFSLNGKQR